MQPRFDYRLLLNVVAQHDQSDDNGNLSVFLQCGSDANFHILPEGSKKVHKALDREVAGLPAHETGNVGLLDT